MLNSFLIWLILGLSLTGVHSAGYKSQYIDTDLGKLHYLSAQGQGQLPPVLLLHGIGSQAADLYPVFERLRPHHRKIIVVDMPAHGHTQLAIKGHSLSEIQRSFYQGLDKLLAHEEPVLLFGNSLGGWQALQYARHNPQELSGLLLVSPAGAQMSETQYQELLHLFQHDSTNNPMEIVRRLFNELPPRPELTARMIQARFSTPQLQAFMQLISRDSMLQPRHLQTLKMPVLLVWGQKDRFFPGQLPFFQANLPAGSEIVQPPDFTHSPYLEGQMDQQLVKLMLNWSQRFVPAAALP